MEAHTESGFDLGFDSLSASEGGIGPGPTETILATLAACTAMDVASILRKKRQNLTDLAVYVSGEQDSDPPWTFRNFHLHYVVTGQGLSEKAVADAIHLSEEKYCSVAATLRLGVPVTSDYEIVEEIGLPQAAVMTVQ